MPGRASRLDLDSHLRVQLEREASAVRSNPRHIWFSGREGVSKRFIVHSDFCGLSCKGGGKCPTGTTCEMPSGTCAYPYPMGEPEDLEAAALDEQLTEFYSVPEPTLELGKGQFSIEDS